MARASTRGSRRGAGLPKAGTDHGERAAKLALDARWPRVTARPPRQCIGRAASPGWWLCGIAHSEDSGAGAVLRMHGPREDQSLVPTHPTDYRTWSHGAVDAPLTAVEAAFRELPELDAVFTTHERECAWGIYRVHRSLKARVEPVQAWDALLDLRWSPASGGGRAWEALDGDSAALSSAPEGPSRPPPESALARALWIVMRRGTGPVGRFASFAALLGGRRAFGSSDSLGRFNGGADFPPHWTSPANRFDARPPTP